MAAELMGATVQGLFGFGINLVAAPLLVVIDPHFAPAPVVLASMVGSALVTVRERGNIDRPAVGWALAGRVPGTAVGAAVVVLVAGAELGVAVGILVLIGVALVIFGRAITRTRRTLLAIGVASGFMSTIAGLGGAPFGLACHDLPGKVLRPTLGVYVLAGAVMSAIALAIAGKVDGEALRLTALLIPGVLVGFGLSSLLVPTVDQWESARPAVLTIATAGALAAIAKGIW
jgi:uncharacterized membrane protein YfcA